ncbi:hypothetical protein SPI_08087 [Niveomyces insectorum RCEF 264]|uniref:Uncharacterized protein n=1 Tax=Niveomyces insectorum RCEF 264 TaxID=1081102 RepID=A0A162MGX1_9HYPO|nr:hypothetical protein SPI_08087 [Niveomyces insectorum RCEF 264]
MLASGGRDFRLTLWKDPLGSAASHSFHAGDTALQQRSCGMVLWLGPQPILQQVGKMVLSGHQAETIERRLGAILECHPDSTAIAVLDADTFAVALREEVKLLGISDDWSVGSKHAITLGLKPIVQFPAITKASERWDHHKVTASGNLLILAGQNGQPTFVTLHPPSETVLIRYKEDADRTWSPSALCDEHPPRLEKQIMTG